MFILTNLKKHKNVLQLCNRVNVFWSDASTLSKMSTRTDNVRISSYSSVPRQHGL